MDLGEIHHSGSMISITEQRCTVTPFGEKQNFYFELSIYCDGL